MVARHMGRRPRRPGGRPCRVEIRLDEMEMAALTVGAVRAELATGAYAATLVRRAIALDSGQVPAEWSEVMRELLAHRAELARIRVDAARVANNLNQIARHLHEGRAVPGAAVGWAVRQVGEVYRRTGAQVVELDRWTAMVRDRLT
jgi:mobilization protein MobC